jgi:hypothetical protein
MEIDITAFVHDHDPYDFSGSRMERGDNAAQQTWNNANTLARTFKLLTTPDELDVFRDHMRDYGAWDAEEIAAWSDVECNALFIQLVSGDMREAGMDDCDMDEFNWDEYVERQQAGRVDGNIFKGMDGRIYYYLGS